MTTTSTTGPTDPAASTNPHLPAKLALKLLASDPEMILAVVRHSGDAAHIQELLTAPEPAGWTGRYHDSRKYAWANSLCSNAVANPAATDAVLAQVVTRAPETATRILALERITHAGTLSALARRNRNDVLRTLAVHPHLPAEGAGRLAEHADPHIRALAAAHPRCPASAREALAADYSVEVRTAVARSPHASGGDLDVAVRTTVSRTPLDDLRTGRGGCRNTLSAAAAHPNARSGTLVLLAAYDIAEVAGNTSTPVEILAEYAMRSRRRPIDRNRAQMAQTNPALDLRTLSLPVADWPEARRVGYLAELAARAPRRAEILVALAEGWTGSWNALMAAAELLDS